MHHRGCAFPSQAHSSAVRSARHSFPFRGAHGQVHRGSDRWRDSGGGGEWRWERGGVVSCMSCVATTHMPHTKSRSGAGFHWISAYTPWPPEESGGQTYGDI